LEPRQNNFIKKIIIENLSYKIERYERGGLLITHKNIIFGHGLFANRSRDGIGLGLAWNITSDVERETRQREREKKQQAITRRQEEKSKCNLLKPKVTCMHECNDDAQTGQENLVAHLGCYITSKHLGTFP
jgi:hypothetical protein